MKGLGKCWMVIGNLWERAMLPARYQMFGCSHKTSH